MEKEGYGHPGHLFVLLDVGTEFPLQLSFDASDFHDFFTTKQHNNDACRWLLFRSLPHLTVWHTVLVSATPPPTP